MKRKDLPKAVKRWKKIIGRFSTKRIKPKKVKKGKKPFWIIEVK